MNSSTTIRPADPGEAESLSALACRSKAYWGYSREFIDACQNELSVTPEDIMGTNRHYIACEEDSKIVGYFAIELISPEEFELEALFVEPEYIGQGYGRMLMDQAKHMARDCGALSLLVQGDPHAESFYESAGGVRIGERESNSIPGRYLPVFRVSLNSENIV